MTTYAEVLEQLVDVNRRIDAAAKACAEKDAEVARLHADIEKLHAAHHAEVQRLTEGWRQAHADARASFDQSCQNLARAEKAEAELARLVDMTRLPVGTAVDVTLDDGTVWRTKTRSEPWQLKSGHWLVSLEGKAGGYSLERVRRASE